jgi:plastocyanin
MKRAPALAALGAALLLTAACGNSSKAGGGSSAPVTGNAVQVKNFSFAPKTLTVPVGTKVTWTFEDSTAHNVTANDKSFGSKDLASGQSYSFTFNSAGNYSYLCTIHPFMTATVVVH